MDLAQLCKAFALNERQALAYKTVLEHGRQPASRLASMAGLPRNTMRGLLDKLAALGLVSRSTRSKTQFYEAESKETLLRSIEGRLETAQEEMRRQLKFVSSMEDTFFQNRAGFKRPRVTFYDGLDGLQRVYEDTLTARNGLRSWASFDANQEALPRYFKSYYRRRASRGIPMRSIHPDTSLARQHMRENRKVLRTAQLVPHRNYSWTPEIQVYNNKVNIASWRDRMGVILESQELADALAVIFDLNFDLLRRRSKR